MVVSRGRLFGDVGYVRTCIPNAFFCVAVSQERRDARNASGIEEASFILSCAYVRTYVRAYVPSCVPTQLRAHAQSARASVRPRARLALRTDGDRGACSVCQSVQRALVHSVDHALGQPTAVGGERVGRQTLEGVRNVGGR